MWYNLFKEIIYTTASCASTKKFLIVVSNVKEFYIKPPREPQRLPEILHFRGGGGGTIAIQWKRENNVD